MEKGLETRPGKLLADRPELRLELVAETPWLGASHATLGSGGPVPPAHLHRGHADCFDQHDPPQDGSADPASVVVTRLTDWGAD